MAAAVGWDVRAGVYVAILRRPQALRLLLSSALVSVSGTMTPVALVLFTRYATGSYGSASIVLAAETVGGIATSPLRGRLVDRRGPAQVLPLLAVATAAADVVFIALGVAHGQTVALASVALVGAATGPPVGASMRNAWRALLGEESNLRPAYALLTIQQEVAFFLGPLFAGVILAVASPTWAVAVAAGASLTGSLVFASAPLIRAQRPQSRTAGRRLGALASGGTRTVVATAALFGATFGALDVAMPALAASRDHLAVSGLLLSAFAVGVGAGGFLYGLGHSSRSSGERYPRLCALAAVGLTPLLALPPLAVTVLLMVVAGLCFAPITTAQLAVLDEVAPEGTRTEAMTWLGTAYGVCSAAGAAIAGQLIDTASIRVAIASAVLATTATFVLTTVRRESLTPTRIPGRHPTPELG